MANKKFSEFTVKTSTSDVDFVVGYDGTDNVRITPANLTGGGGASDLNGLTDCLVDTNSLYVGEVPSGLSGNPQNNTILGIDAGASITTGNDNTLIGREAGKSGTAGNFIDNVLIGNRAGQALNVFQNVVIGNQSYENGTGCCTVAIGHRASSSGGAHVVAIGREAGLNNSQDNCIIIGSAAARQGNSSAGHVSVGYQSGYSQTSGANNTNIGYQAGYSNTTGASRVMLGYEAGKNNTGSNNVFLGKATGKGSGSGSQTIAIGQGVMESGSAANNSVFIGNYMAANTISGADSTVAIGTNCLSAAGYSGESNTVVGHQAGNNLSSGDNNTMIGRQAGDATTTGASNTLIGYQAGLAITTAGNNVLIGYQSGKALTAGGNSGSNVFVGYQTGFGANNANYNTLLGYQTGYGLTNGENNTIIGSFASAYGGALTTGDNNTIIGNAAYPSSATVNNEITLGNSSISTLRCAVTSITSLSDERDKSEIKDITYGLAFIDALQPREFVWNNRPETNKDGEEFFSSNKGKKDFGFIAQEVKELDNDTLRLVYDENPEKLELSYGKLVPVLVQAIKELKVEIELLKS